MNVEQTILQNLVSNEDYIRKVLPFIKRAYFGEREDQMLFKQIRQFAVKYKKPPTVDALKVEIGQLNDLNDEEYDEILNRLEKFDKKPNEDLQWLVDKTEEWCKERACYNAVMTSINILDGEDKKHDEHSIPDLLREAISVTFDLNIGHDYFKDAESRFEFYHNVETKIPFDIELLNKITNGGVTRKTLNIIIAGTNVGKSLVMCHLAASYIAQGMNVLYISLEMAEELVAQRIDANLMDIKYNEIEKLNRKSYLKNIIKLHKKHQGRLLIKEYPSSVSHVGHFRFLIKELEMKRKFKPDVIIVDYLGICGSSRYKAGGVNPSYYLKSVAEELRGMGQEFDAVVWSGAQFNREGMSDSDADLDSTAESIGITHTADLMFSLYSDEELDNLNQYLCKQLKNRYQNKNNHRRFVIGVEKDKSKLFNLNHTSQETTVVETPEIRDNERKTSKKKYEGFKV